MLEKQKSIKTEKHRFVLIFGGFGSVALSIAAIVTSSQSPAVKFTLGAMLYALVSFALIAAIEDDIL